MTESKSDNKPPDDRKQRLSAALRANLQRRKLQARERKTEVSDTRTQTGNRRPNERA